MLSTKGKKNILRENGVKIQLCLFCKRSDSKIEINSSIYWNYLPHTSLWLNQHLQMIKRFVCVFSKCKLTVTVQLQNSNHVKLTRFLWSYVSPKIPVLYLPTTLNLWYFLTREQVENIQTKINRLSRWSAPSYLFIIPVAITGYHIRLSVLS